MRIEGFRVEGFGILSGLEVSDLPPGMTVLFGPNEAGKSTLVDFLRGVLFGFAGRRRSEEQHEPLRGGGHGGSVSLLDERGGAWTVTRLASGARRGATGTLTITAPDGAGREEDLRRLLGGADAELFRNVFAFSTDELHAVDSLDLDSVRELVFSAAVVGGGRSATGVMRELEDRAGAIAAPRRASAAANDLQRRLDEAERSLLAAKDEAARYGYQARALDRVSGRVDELRRQRIALARRLNELERLRRLAAVRRGAEKARSRLCELPAADGSETALCALAPELEAAMAELSGHRERARRHNELAASQMALAASVGDRLRRMGPGWDRSRVLGVDASLPVMHEVREQLRLLGLAETAGREQRARVDDAGERLTLLGEATRAGDGALASADIERSRDLLRRYRTLRELAARSRERARGEELAEQLARLTEGGSAGGRRASAPAVVAATLGGVLAIVGALAVARGTAAEVIAGLILLSLAVVVGAALAIARRGRRREAPERIDSAAAGVSRRSGTHSDEPAPAVDEDPIAGELAAIGEALELPADVTPAELDEIEGFLERQLAEARRRDLKAEQLLEAKRAFERQRDLLEQRLGELDARAGDWQCWLRDRALPETLTPAAALSLLEEIDSARVDIASLDRIGRHLVGLGGELETFAARARSLLARGGSDTGPEGEEGSLALLAAEARSALENRAARAAIAAEIEAAERLVSGELAVGSAGERLLAELGVEGEMRRDKEAEACEGELAVVDAAIEKGVREHQDCARELSAVGASSRIATIELEVVVLRQQLDDALAEWWVTSLARALVEATLARYERERQPAVIARASQHFCTITDGHYERLVVRDARAGRGRGLYRIDAVNRWGERIEAAELSRGTLEQLYLCMRLGLAESFAATSAALPILMDDVLVNFDHERAVRVASVLAGTAERQQVLVLTCHPHVVEELLAAAPAAAIVELPRFAGRAVRGAPSAA